MYAKDISLYKTMNLIRRVGSQEESVHHLQASRQVGAPVECVLLKQVNFATLADIVIKSGAVMLNAKIFEEIAAKLNEAVKNSPAKDIEKNMRALLVQGFAKLDLVTREEFDAQTQVLARAREQLDVMAARVTELEARQK